jgi:hypothetical protein
MDFQELLDENLYKVISKCFINNKRADISEIFVIYTDDTRETIWTFNPTRYSFIHHEFIGKTKIEAIFYCDRKEPRSMQRL